MDWGLLFAWTALDMAALVACWDMMAHIMGLDRDKTGWLECVLGAIASAIVRVNGLPAVFACGVLMLALTIVIWRNGGGDFRLALFVAYMWAIGIICVADFECGAGLMLWLGNPAYANQQTPAGLMGPLFVCAVLLVSAFLVARTGASRSAILRSIGLVATAELVFGVYLSMQTFPNTMQDDIGVILLLGASLIPELVVYRLRAQCDSEQRVSQAAQERADAMERDYAALRSTYEGNARLYHDLHNHIDALHYCLAQKDYEGATRYCEELRETALRTVQATRYTGDNVADFLISSKLAQAQELGIRTQVDITCPKGLPVRSVDLTAIVGNLLDNAIEGAQTAPPEHKKIALTILPAKQMLLIRVVNGCAQAPRKVRGKWITRKANEKGMHGWGLQNVQEACKKYDGALDTDYADDMFTASALLALRPDSQAGDVQSRAQIRAK